MFLCEKKQDFSIAVFQWIVNCTCLSAPQSRVLSEFAGGGSLETMLKMDADPVWRWLDTR